MRSSVTVTAAPELTHFLLLAGRSIVLRAFLPGARQSWKLFGFKQKEYRCKSRPLQLPPEAGFIERFASSAQAEASQPGLSAQVLEDVEFLSSVGSRLGRSKQHEAGPVLGPLLLFTRIRDGTGMMSLVPAIRRAPMALAMRLENTCPGVRPRRHSRWSQN